MAKFTRVTLISSKHDDVTGAQLTILSRALQPLNKDRRPSKRAVIQTPARLVKYPDGSFRYYGPHGVLAREKISAKRLDAEINAVDWREDVLNFGDE